MYRCWNGRCGRDQSIDSTALVGVWWAADGRLAGTEITVDTLYPNANSDADNLTSKVAVVRAEVKLRNILPIKSLEKTKQIQPCC